MGWEDFFSSLFGGQIGNTVAGVGGSVAQNKIIKDIEGLGAEDYRTVYGNAPPSYETGGLMGKIGQESQFKPFAITTPTGSTASLSATGMTSALSPEEKALQDSLQGFGGSAFNFLGDPTARQAEQESLIGMLTQDRGQRSEREEELFNRFNSVLAPSRERDRLALEERLYGQGRTGVRTGLYGGTPEQLAMEKAIAEQQAGLSVSAIEQARQEQALQSEQTLAGLGEARNRMQTLGDLGFKGLEASYYPQKNLFDALDPQLEASRLASALQSTGLTTGAGLAESTLESQLNYNVLANALRQKQFQGFFDLLKGQQAGSQTSTTNTLNSGWNEMFAQALEAAKQETTNKVSSLFGN